MSPGDAVPSLQKFPSGHVADSALNARLYACKAGVGRSTVVLTFQPPFNHLSSGIKWSKRTEDRIENNFVPIRNECTLSCRAMMHKEQALRDRCRQYATLPHHHWAGFRRPIDAESRLRQIRQAHKLKIRGRSVMNVEQRIVVCKAGITQIYAMLRTSPQSWRSYLNLARSIIVHFDSTTFMRQPSRTAEQIWVITGLQQLAQMDTDDGGASVADITSWCSRHWLEISQRDPHNIAALRGIGQSWLHRARPVLSRIHRESSSSSSGGGSQLSVTSPSDNDERPGSGSSSDRERRMDTQDYVEARQFLHPAAEYLERAVTAATTQNALSGDLLVSAAEAHMSLGNVSSPRSNESHFHRALGFVRQASGIPDFHLPRHLQHYLDEYGRLLV